jgi:hypothetical protein
MVNVKTARYTVRTSSMFFFCALALLFGNRAACAQVTTESTGVIARMMVVAGPGGAPGNADLRIWLAGSPVLCSGGVTDATWAFLNSNDPNHKAVQAMAMLAYSSNKPVTISAWPAALNGGTYYCQLRWLSTVN